ncbi:MAG: hypothetical protein IPH18_13565 [Chitinophagaceae bacterium]|nr:hypothetical protein [Chitinophagaceae bacterium]MBK8952360.1 hypothetical protein [Chitinophagaceae bacterium]
MASSGSSSSSGGNLMKTIIGGVLTTVLGAAAIYFLGFHDSGKTEKKKRKEATVTAWNSLLQYEKLFQQTTDKMICMDETEDEAKTITDDMEQLINDMGNIKKEENIDNRMVTLVDRRIESYKKRKNYIAEYYDEIIELSGTAAPQEEMNSKATAIQKRLSTRVKELERKDGEYIKEISQTLEKTYNVTLSVPEFNTEVNKENVAGDWKINKATQLTLAKDGSFSWLADEKKLTGNWDLQDKIIQLIFSDGEKLSYNIKSLNTLVIRLENTGDGSFAFGCRN